MKTNKLYILIAVIGGALANAGVAVTLDDLQANPVPALGQNAEDVRVFDPTKGPRVLFVGNSITLHGPRPEIGWTNNWGMAASAMEKDYVHLVRERLLALQPDTQCCLLQVADTFERSFFRADWRPEDHFVWAREFKPDIVLFFFGANVPGEYDSGTLNPAAARSFGEALEALRDYLNTGTTRFFVSQGFYIRPVLDDEKRALCSRRDDAFIDIDDIRSRLDTHGMFNHPNDLGMALLAERFAETMTTAKALSFSH